MMYLAWFAMGAVLTGLWVCFTLWAMTDFARDKVKEALSAVRADLPVWTLKEESIQADHQARRVQVRVYTRVLGKDE